jgi:hypothetical protein
MTDLAWADHEEVAGSLRRDNEELLRQLRELRGRLDAEREDAKKRAIDALAAYKFWMFGYHAARWVTMNRLIGDRQPNPFNPIVQAARRLLNEWSKAA